MSCLLSCLHVFVPIFTKVRFVWDKKLYQSHSRHISVQLNQQSFHCKLKSYGPWFSWMTSFIIISSSYCFFVKRIDPIFIWKISRSKTTFYHLGYFSFVFTNYRNFVLLTLLPSTLIYSFIKIEQSVWCETVLGRFDNQLDT